MFYEVIPTRIFRQNSRALTYHSDAKLEIGQLVMIPLGRVTVPGIVFKKIKKPNFPTKKISQILYEQPLPKHLVDAVQWLADYYLAPLPQVVNLMLPVGVNKKRRMSKIQSKKTSKTNAEIPLNVEQKRALEQIRQYGAGTQFLHGVTGSGKTHIYLQLAKDALEQGKSTILLVPEIALTSQLVQIFTKTFGTQIALLHSRQTEAERHLEWEKILHSKKPLVVIGPRSALFAPVADLGLIIIDEAHENTYFQENTPKYSAIRLASMIAQQAQIPCVLGTATPLAVDYYLAKQKNALVSLTHKAKTEAHPPQIFVVDLKDKNAFSRNRYFSNQLLKALEKILPKNVKP